MKTIDKLRRKTIIARKLHSYSQDMLAFKSDVTQKTISEWESGKSDDIKLSTLIKLCNVLELKIEVTGDEV